MSKRVFLLGAGASKAILGLPCIAEFVTHGMHVLEEKGKKLAKRMSETNLSDRTMSRLEQRVTQLNSLSNAMKDTDFRGFLDSGTLEDALTHIDMSLDPAFGKAVPPRRIAFLQKAKQDLTLFVRETLDLDRIEREAVTKYDLLFGTLTDDDTVITTNYDVGIEMYLDQMQSAPEVFSLHESLLSTGEDAWASEWLAAGGLVKLHGSLNWTSCPYPQCDQYTRIQVESIDDSIRQDRTDPICGRCGSTKEYVMVPPVANKSFGRFPQGGLLWRKAVQDIQEALTIVIFGFSAAPSDGHMQWLLRNIQRADVSIIDPSPESQRRILDNLPSNEFFRSERNLYRSLQEYGARFGPEAS